MNQPAIRREEYMRKVLDAYRRTPGLPERSAAMTVCWPPNCISAVCPWVPSKTPWCWPQRAACCAPPPLQPWPPYVP